MKVLGPNILLFERSVDKKLLSDLDLYYNVDNSVKNEGFCWVSNLDESGRESIKRFILKRIKESFYSHYLYPDSPYNILNYTKIDWFSDDDYKNPDLYKNKLESDEYFETGWSGAMLLSRPSSIYNGNRVKWAKSDKSDKFTHLIGLSESNEHDSEIIFPLHDVRVKLNRGDFLIFPAGIITPYVMTLHNGHFKFIESV